MNALKIGLRLESLAMPLRGALAEAARLGVGGVRIDAAGDLSPDRLSHSGRRELLHLVRSHNLELTALGCPLRRGLDNAQNLQPRIEHVQKVLSLSAELGPRVVVVQGGAVPEEDGSEKARLMAESLDALGRHGDRVGATLAQETGLESGSVLAAYLRRFDSGALGANFDPANLLLHGLDPYQSVRDLRGLVRQVNATDARRASASRAAQEVALGAGDMDWMQLLGLLEEIEYRGWLVVCRDSGENRLADVATGVAVLRRILP